MGLFDQDILNSSTISDEDKAKYKAAMDEADAKEEARYKSGPNRDDMTSRRKVAAGRARRAKKDASKMNMGGKVAGYKNGGCVMSGRGGKYKGAM
jgi:hypothetical protein